MRLRLIFTVTFICSCCFAISNIHAQTIPLPSDLIFPVEDDRGNLTVLMRVDAKTHSISQFYQDAQNIISLRVLKWSPDGQKLAIGRRIENTITQICIVNRSGLLLNCMQPPAAFATNNFFESLLDSVSWSGDGQRLYFVSQRYDSSSSTPIQLIEVNVATGQTVRLIHETIGKFSSLTYVWNADVSSILLGSISGYSKNDQSTPLAFLAPNEAIQPPSQSDLMTTVTSRTDLMYLCGQASPKGTYFSLIEGDKSSLIGNAIVILNAQGQVVDRINALFSAGQIKVICPTWSWDERYIFFGAYIGNEYQGVIRYSLLDKTADRYEPTSETLSDGSGVGISSPYRISFDNRWIAGRQYVYKDGPTWQAAVLGPNGEYLTFTGDWRSAGIPLWVPPLP